MNYFAMVEDAWKLSDDIRKYNKESGRDVDLNEIWEKILSSSPLVDIDRTKSEGEFPPTRVFLKSPYGLAYRPDNKDWIPFRHADIIP